MALRVNIRQCRLCAKSTGDLISLFGEGSSNRNLVKIIRERLQVTISENDPLPKTVCITCKKTLEEFESFRQSCILAEKVLKTSHDSSSLLIDSQDITVSGVSKFLSLPSCVEPIPQQIQNVKVEICETDLESNNTYQDLSCQDLDSDNEGATVKEPHQDDYILVKEEAFTLGDGNNRVPNNFVEFSRPGIKPSDRTLINNVKKREVLPQMWDVYEKQITHNITNVVMRRYIISKAAFPCSLCNKCVILQRNVSKEEDSCDRTYRSEISDSRSMSYRFGEEMGELLECEYCKRPFPRLNSLKRHLRTHFGYETLPCKICGKGFSRKEHLVRHMLLHTGGRPFECEICKKSFTRKEHLNRHLLIHNETYLGHKTQPDYCSSSFKFEKNGSEVKSKRHTCEICGNDFGRKEHMVRHVRRTHSLSYPDYIPLSNFTITNIGEDSVPAYSTSSEASTNNHVSSSDELSIIHEERNTFHCRLCPRSFSCEAHLLRHLKIHARDSMFVNESRVPGTDITLSLINAND
ncbi:hypothetical protein R5R35_006562 [Gryllus longicercus]|uniref:Zinc finger protein n=1 Tax=Gryllus longicercus TaxID=2509291 RepID=A0AAN9YZ13_9ORTH